MKDALIVFGAALACGAIGGAVVAGTWMVWTCHSFGLW